MSFNIEQLRQICMQFSIEQLRQVCSNLKLIAYWSKPKEYVLHIIGVGKLHHAFYDGGEDPLSKEYNPRVPAKTRNCVFGSDNELCFLVH
jgi:hypothetical protein